MNKSLEMQRFFHRILGIGEILSAPGDALDEINSLIRDKVRLTNELNEANAATLEFSKLFERHHTRADVLQTALVDLLKVISDDRLIVGGRAYLDAARRVVLNTRSRQMLENNYKPVNVGTIGHVDHSPRPTVISVDIPLELLIGCPKCDYDEAEGGLVNHCDDCCVALMMHVYGEVSKTHEMV